MNSLIYRDVVSEEAETRLKCMNKLEELQFNRSQRVYKAKIKIFNFNLIVLSKLVKIVKSEIFIKNRKDRVFSFLYKVNGDKISSSYKSLNYTAAKSFADESSIVALRKPELSAFTQNRYRFSVNVESADYFLEAGERSSGNSIAYENSFSILSKMEFVKDKSNKQFRRYGIVKSKLRKFSYCYIIDDREISCFFYCYYTPKFNLNNIKTIFLGTCKLILILLIICSIWVCLLFVIAEIYTNYGENIFKICIMPLISTLIVNLFIVSNLLILVSSYLMITKGVFIYSIKSFSFLKLIFNALVPKTASNSHQSILLYKGIIDKIKKQ